MQNMVAVLVPYWISKQEEGNRKRLAGNVSVNPFQSKILLEGPIKKLVNDRGGSTSFMLTAKHSYINETSKTLYEYATDSLGLPYQFTDFYGKISTITPNGSKFNFFGFNYDDKVDFRNVAKLGWKASGGGTNFTLIPAASSMLIGGHISFTDYDITLEEADDRPRKSGINGFNAGLDFTYFGDNNELKYGFEINGFKTSFEFENFAGNRIEQVENTTELSGFFRYQHKLNKLIIEPSFRLQYYASLNQFSAEPRLGLKYNATDFLRFKAAGGLYSQNLISSVNDRDIVNLFVGFLSGPNQQLFDIDGNEAKHKLQKAVHVIAGVEIDLGDHFELNVEPYYKGFTQLIEINRNKLLATDPDYLVEEGEAYGIDFSLRYEKRRLYAWATYSLGHVTRDDGIAEFPTNFDRRHNVNLLTTYTFGAEQDWEFAARWNMGSGFPFTLTQGFFSWYTFQNGIQTNVLTENAELGIIFNEERNTGRLPYYHRLDISLKKRFTFGQHTKLEIVGSITNVYDRKNIFFFDRVRYERVDQLPILPSLGLIFEF